MKAIEQYFHVVLFIMLYKVVLPFRSVNEALVCDHSNESYRAVPFQVLTLRSKWTIRFLCMCSTPCSICFMYRTTSFSVRLSSLHTFSNSSPPEILRKKLVISKVQLAWQFSIVNYTVSSSIWNKFARVSFSKS